MTPGPLKFGIDLLLERGLCELRRARIGLITNDAARTATNPERTAREALLEAGFSLCRLFSPEHGMRACAQDGRPVSDSRDPVTGLRIRSLYGRTMTPGAGDLRGLDALVVDLPDAGYRFYTYCWTLYLAMEACESRGLPLFVLDRPNPVGGLLAEAEGPVLDIDRHGSFLGLFPMPIRHSLTLGELARLWQTKRFRRANLKVVPVEFWRRHQHWPDTGLRFIPPSPAIRSYESALFYGGLCFLEATNVSAGRGTEYPFRQFGAPWVNAEDLVSSLRKCLPEAVRLEPVSFVPREPPCRGEWCFGVRLHARTPKEIRPVQTGFQILALLIAHHRDRFSWTPYPTAANPAGADHFDRLAGRSFIRQRLEQGAIEPAEFEQWTVPGEWAQTVSPFLLYE